MSIADPHEIIMSLFESGDVPLLTEGTTSDFKFRTTFFIIMLLFVSYKFLTNTKKPVEKIYPKYYTIKEVKIITIDDIYDELVKQEIKCPDIVIKQVILETYKMLYDH